MVTFIRLLTRRPGRLCRVTIVGESQRLRIQMIGLVTLFLSTGFGYCSEPRGVSGPEHTKLMVIDGDVYLVSRPDADLVEPENSAVLWSVQGNSLMVYNKQGDQGEKDGKWHGSYLAYDTT